MAKVILKCGDVQIEYDGPEEFLKSELGSLVKATIELRSIAKAEPGAKLSSGTSGGAESVSMIAQQMGAKNGPTLIMAAAAALARAGNSSFTKKQIRDSMRDAKSFYKASYMNNFDNYVARLTKNGKLNHIGGENYALPLSA